jgi:hypothetical protein
MSAPTGLGQYVPPAASQGDRIQAQQMVDRPILVWVRNTKFLNKTKFSAEGGTAVYLDFIDLSNNQVYIEVMWMAGAIVDGLKQYAGDGCAYPIKVVRVEGGAHGSYNTIKSLSDDQQWMNHVLTNLPIFQQMVAQTRAQKEQEWATAMQQANQPPQVPGGPPPAPALPAVGAAAPPFQQPGQQAQYATPAAPPQPTLPPQYAANPQAGLHDQVMVMQPPHVQQALQQAPSQQFQQPAGPPPQYQQQQQQQQAPPAQPPQPVAPPAQPGYPPQQYAPQAAVAPPQYGAPAAPAAPPGPPQQFQQPGPPAAPAQQYAPQGPPQPPGAVTGQSVAELQAALNQIG